MFIFPAAHELDFRGLKWQNMNFLVSPSEERITRSLLMLGFGYVLRMQSDMNINVH
jgi:hypothetical protein